MADVLGAASAAFGLLEMGIRLIGRVRKAYERQKNLTDVLDKHTLSLGNVKTVIQVIQDEDALQTAKLAPELIQLKDVEEELVSCLKKLEPGEKGPARKLIHQLAHGSKDEKTLADIMEELDRCMSTICLRIQLANVGVTRTIGDMVLANAEVVNRIDDRLVQVLGEGGGLKLARLLKGRSREVDGMVTLSKAEIASLSMEADSSTSDSKTAAESTHDSETIDRVIVGNSAKDQAVAILGPVGNDIWRGLSVRIENNHATGKAALVGYASDIETLKYLLDRQERLADKEADRQERLADKEAERKRG